jgi:SAM-dependent MidA family methyltransferase
LPPSHPASLALSGQLLDRIAARIRQDGPLRFDLFQAMALYEPGLGYYAGPLHKFGQEGDFVTAPDLSPLFAATLARAIAPLVRRVPRILEMGPGQGTLARGLIEHLDTRPLTYQLLELSSSLAARQQATLSDAAIGGVDTQWLEAWPEAIEGVVIANEVLDAIPVRLLIRDGEAIRERYVTLSGEGQFAWVDIETPSGSDAHTIARERLPAGNEPYLSEWSPQGEAWIASIAERLTQGVAIFIDYGFAAREFYHPTRNSGTLMCHYRHHAHPDPLLHVGLQDITSHVDFSAMARAAVDAGARVLHFGTQGQFLLGMGLLDALAALTPGTLAYVQASAGLQRLVSPAEMGELFKVLVIGRGDVAELFDTRALRAMAL